MNELMWMAAESHEDVERLGLTTANASTESALFHMRREWDPLSILARFVVKGEPVSKARARVAHGRAYTPAKTKTQEEYVAWRFREAARRHVPQAGEEYGLVALFFCAKRQVRDVDNMLKLICDALNGVAWVDDAQVSEVSGRRTWCEAGEERTEILIYRIPSHEGNRRTKQCRNCDQPFYVQPCFISVRHYCSPACSEAYFAARQQRTCAGCGRTFRNRNANRYCSQDCLTRAHNTLLRCSRCGREHARWTSLVKKANSSACSQGCWTGNGPTEELLRGVSLDPQLLAVLRDPREVQSTNKET